ncbi:EAL domain-containing protein [Limoniibacter endophyticus]|nr:EAL domain-containing protein [Limoniibacter endophyticus]
MAQALEPIVITPDSAALDLTQAVEIYRNQSGSFQVSTAPGEDGIVRRIEVEPKDQQSNGNWAVFALANTSDQQLDRLIVAPHFRLVDSGLLKPDLGSRRISTITPSEGFALDRQKSADADVFLLTINPGAVVTFVAEMSASNLPQIYLWQPDAYKDSINSYTLYRGIVIGIAGLLALFLTILFVVRGTSMFPATAALAWSVLAYICVDFGFLNQVMEIAPGNEQIWRAGAEVALATTLMVFLFTYLNLNRWHGHFSYGAVVWTAFLCLIAGFAVFEPNLAAGLARISIAATALLGLGLIVYLGYQGFDRAIMLVPSWLMVLTWLGGSWLAISGILNNDIIQPALGGALVLIILLIGFTVIQHAFTGGALHTGLFSDMERQALAVTGAGDIVWDWDVARDRIVTRPDIAALLGHEQNELVGPARDWLPMLHPDDRDIFRSTLDALIEQKRGRLSQSIRMRGADGHYHWYALRARPVMGSDGEIIRCVGTMIDITKQKQAEQRLLRDAAHDNLTGLANREIFLNRLDATITVLKSGATARPTLFVVDIDDFKRINDQLGISAGDTILLTIARRLHRILRPNDSLARLSGDQFALMLLSEQEPARIAAMADAIRQAIRAPIVFAKREVVLTPSIGLITWTQALTCAEDMLKDAELAMHQAKSSGGDRIEPFRPAFRSAGNDRQQLQSDLKRAIERKEFYLSYLPVYRIEDRSVACFQTILHWDNPRRGLIEAHDFLPTALSCGMAPSLLKTMMQGAADDLSQWSRQSGNIPLSVSVKIGASVLLRDELVNDVRSVIARANIKPRALRLEINEADVMENPEQIAQVLMRLQQMGVGLTLDRFGSGNCSLAYITRLPFDTLKISPNFVELDANKRVILLRSMVNLAHELGLAVIVEDVANEADALHLRQMGCEYMQTTQAGNTLLPADVIQLLREGLQPVVPEKQAS